MLAFMAQVFDTNRRIVVYVLVFNKFSLSTFYLVDLTKSNWNEYKLFWVKLGKEYSSEILQRP